MPNKNSRRLRIHDVQDRLGGVSRRTVYRYVQRGLIPPGRQQGGFTFWEEGDLAALLETPRGLRRRRGRAR